MATYQKTTADRWQAALDRAIAEGLDPLALAGMAGAFAVESATRPGTAYLVTGGGAACSCPAGERGIPCKHRACVMAALGTMPQPPAAPAPYAIGKAARIEAMRATGRRPAA